MPQTKAEKKFLQTRVGKTHYNFPPLILSVHTLAEFQGFKKNMTGGEK